MNLFKNYKWLSGYHKREGIFLLLGKDIKKGRQLKEINIEDIFPALLALNDEKVPDYIDGKVIKDIFNKEIKENYVNFKPAIKDKKYQYSKTDEHDLIETFDFPCITKARWIYQCCRASGLGAYTLFGEYFSKEVRLKIIKKLLLKNMEPS